MDTREVDMEGDTALVLTLGRALQWHGVPSGRIEEVLGRVAVKLELRVEVFATVTALIVRFGEPEELRTTFLRLSPTEVNLGTLASLDRTIHGFLDGSLDKAALRVALANLSLRTGRQPLAVRILVAGLGGAGWCVLLGGALPELSCAALASGAIEALSDRVERRSYLKREFAALSGVIAGVSVSLAAALFASFDRQTTLIAALIPLLPGFALVTAAEELASDDLLTGSARLTSAALLVAQLVFGVALGSQLSKLLPAGAVDAPTHPRTLLTQLLMLVPAISALMLRLRVDPRDLGGCYAAGLVSFGMARVASQLVGVELGAFVGALLVGTLGNASARWLRTSALSIIVPGVLVLVPGSLSFRSANALWSSEPLEGLRVGFSALFMAVAIATGLILASSLVPPRRPL